MAEITITIPDNRVVRVLDALKMEYRQNNGESDNAFGKRQVIEFLIRTVKAAESSAAGESARQAAQDDVDANVPIT